MALTPGKLHTALKKAMHENLNDKLGKDDSGDHRGKFCDALAKAVADEVLAHILANLEIPATYDVPAAALAAPSGAAPAPGPLVPCPPGPATAPGQIK